MMDTFVIRTKRKGENFPTKETEHVKVETHQLAQQTDSEKRPKKTCQLRKISREGLDCDYGLLFDKIEADELFKQCEEQMDYFTGKESQVRVFGKWHDIPRKQVDCGVLCCSLTCFWGQA